MLKIEINARNIWIDPAEDWIFGSDQANVNFPCTFPTVTIILSDTLALIKAVDAMRMEAGHKPMFPVNGNTDDAESYDIYGWYDFQVGLNGFTDTMVDNRIEALVRSEEADDDEQYWYIPLTEAEQIAVYKELDKQLKERFETSCDKLLEEARLEMVDNERCRAMSREAF